MHVSRILSSVGIVNGSDNEDREFVDGYFKIVDKTDDGRGEFHLEGPLEELGLGKGESILVTDISDSKMKSVLAVPKNFRVWIDCVFEDWVIFRLTRKRKPRGSVVARLVDGQLKFKLHYGWDTGVRKIGRLEMRKWGDKIAIMEDGSIAYYEEGEWKRGSGGYPTHEFPIIQVDTRTYRSRVRQSRIAFFPAPIDEIIQRCLTEFFGEFGLHFEAINYESFLLTIPPIS